MRLIKLFLAGLVGLFVIVTLLSLLLPSEVKVSRAVIINSTISNVYAQTNNLKNWKNWEPLFANDSSIISYSDTSVYPSCDVNYKGRQIHLAVTSNDPSAMKFTLQSKNEDDLYNEIDVLPVKEGGVQVEWKALTKLKWYPWEKFYGIFIDRLTGPGYEDALNHLKDFVEKK